MSLEQGARSLFIFFDCGLQVKMIREREAHMTTKSELDHNAIFEKFVRGSIKWTHVEVGRKQKEDFQKRLDKLKQEEEEVLRFVFHSLLFAHPQLLVELHGQITLSTSRASTHAQSSLGAVDPRLRFVRLEIKHASSLGEISYTARRTISIRWMSSYLNISLSPPR